MDIRPECTFCPPNTKQCAHFDGHWVRLAHCPDGISPDDVPAVTWNFGYPEPIRPHTTWTIFYYPPSTMSNAEENFHKLNAEMRKIASGSPGDVCT